MAAPAIDESTGLPIVGVFEAINVSTGAIAASREISETITIGRCVLTRVKACVRAECAAERRPRSNSNTATRVLQE